MNFKEYFYTSVLLENWKDKGDVKFEAQFRGALQLVFNIDNDDIIDDDSKIQSYGNKIGMGRMGIGSLDFRVAKDAHVGLMPQFFIQYKAKKYYVSMRVINWNKNPTTEDFLAFAQGKNLDYERRYTESFDNRKPSSAVGRVVLDDTFYNPMTEKEEEEYGEIGSIEGDDNYPEHFRFQSLDQLAQRIKNIIDGRNDRRTNKKPHLPKPSNTITPKSPSPKKPVFA